MEKMLTRRQGTLLIICATIATKIQRLPSIIAHECGRDGWIVGLFLFLLDTIGIFLISAIMENLKDYTIYEIIEKAFGKIISKLFCLIFIVFFFIKSLVAFKGTNDFFSTTLFDMLSWKIFSLLLMLLLLVMVVKGLKVIGRSAELYIYLILFGLVSAIILGATSTDYSKALPLLDNDILELIKNSMNYSVHFGDYVVVLFMMGNIKDVNKKTKWVYSIVHLVLSLFICFAYIVFYGIYDNVAQFQPHALADITQFSLVGLGLGRLDWFLVLFVLIATFISTALYLYIVVYSIKKLIGTEQKFLITILVLIILFIFEFYVFKDTETIMTFIKEGYRYYAVGVEVLSPIILLVCMLLIKHKNRRKTA